MRLAIFIVLLALATSVNAGVASCRRDDRSSWIYYPLFTNDGMIYHDVYCPSYDPRGVVPRSGAGGYSDPNLIVHYELQAGLMLYKITAYKYGW